MRRVGRRNGFLTGGAFGLAGSVMAAAAMSLGSFWLLCAGTLLMGVYNAFGQYYRFAAADATPLSWRARAISLVMAGGLVGGIIGPEMSKHTINLASPTYLASYASLMGFCLVTMVILAMLRIPTRLEWVDRTAHFLCRRSRGRALGRPKQPGGPRRHPVRLASLGPARRRSCARRRDARYRVQSPHADGARCALAIRPEISAHTGGDDHRCRYHRNRRTRHTARRHQLHPQKLHQ